MGRHYIQNTVCAHEFPQIFDLFGFVSMRYIDSVTMVQPHI